MRDLFVFLSSEIDLIRLKFIQMNGITAVEAAFDYHTPVKGQEAFLPPQAIHPEAVPTWNEFTQSTTIHGVRYVFDERSNSIIRR